MKRVALLMAGGRSERLWPMSRARMPKQFLSIDHSGDTMIQLTVSRLLPLIALEDIYVVTGREYVPIVREQLPEMPPENILAEPMGRNTAPCIAFAVAVLRQRYPDAVMMVLASDHLIQQNEEFLANLKDACDFAEAHDTLATIGITPTYPETGYGYVQYDRAHTADQPLYPVKRFVEKPNIELARLYLQSGDYLWNSGMFVWRLSVIDNHFQALMPQVHAGMERIRAAGEAGTLERELPGIFEGFPSVSIDYGIMEHARHIHVIPSTFTWLDIGNWNAMPQVLGVDEHGNAVHGDALLLEAKGNVVHSETGRLINLIGMENVVVVDTQDVLMVAHREALDGVKQTLQKVRETGREEVL